MTTFPHYWKLIFSSHTIDCTCVLKCPFYVIFHCRRPVPIVKNRNTEDGKNQKSFLPYPKYQRYIYCILANKDKPSDSLYTKFILERQVSKNVLVVFARSIFTFFSPSLSLSVEKYTQALEWPTTAEPGFNSTSLESGVMRTAQSIP